MSRRNVEAHRGVEGVEAATRDFFEGAEVWTFRAGRVVRGRSFDGRGKALEAAGLSE
jgi:hypothetical protein